MSVSSPDNPFRVLVVDDDELFADLLTKMLSGSYEVQHVIDGEEAFRTALTFLPDLMILDMRMPKWDGLKTLRAFQLRAELQSTRIIMLTADASRETVIQAIRAGVRDYIVKTSFTREELLLKIRMHLPKPHERANAVNHLHRRHSDMMVVPSDKDLEVGNVEESVSLQAGEPNVGVANDHRSSTATHTASEAPAEAITDADLQPSPPDIASSDVQSIMDDWD